MTVENVVAARRVLAEVEAQKERATIKVIAIDARIADSRTVLDAITARRLSGNISPGDVAEFAVVSADLVGLQAMLDNAQAEVAAANTSPARVALQRAEKDLAEVQTREAFAAVSLRASKLDEALCSCVSEAYELGKKLGLVSLCMAWTPSQKLAEAVKYGRTPK
jgi:hypothetical protein